MNVIAKFKCFSQRKYEGTVWNGSKTEQGMLYAYEMQAVSGGSAENNEFFGSTPSGNLTLSSVRDDLFEVGAYYYLNFTKAEK